MHKKLPHLYIPFDTDGKKTTKAYAIIPRVVYIEEVVADNLFINVILLLITAAVLKRKRTAWRLILSSALGTTFAVFLPFIDKAVIVYKIAALIATTALAAQHKNVKGYLLFVLVFAAVSFAAGGAAYGLFNLTVGKNGMLTYPSGGAVKYAVYGAVAFTWIVSRQIRRFAARRRILASKRVSAQVVIGESKFDVDCLDDTGNRLVDSLTAKPVAVLSHDVGAHYVGESARNIKVETAVGAKYLPVITAEKLTVDCDGEKSVYEKMPLAVADADFDGYKMIINVGAL